MFKFRAKMSEIDDAAKLLRAGGIVAFPTETVYGLGGSIRHPQALEAIFSTKRRPFFDPLICHIHSEEQIAELSNHWPEWAQVLTNKFWPGPLTVVVEKNSSLNSLITSGLNSVGIRMPSHPIAQALLSAVDIPLAAPSANRFGRTSPTLASHVREEFADEKLVILDGGPSVVGIESTVVSFDSDEMMLSILRPGFITESQLMEELTRWNPRIRIGQGRRELSPGHTEFHYQPARPLVLIEGDERDLSVVEVEDILDKLGIKRENCSERIFSVLSLAADPVVSARILYGSMRDLAATDIEMILVFRDHRKQGELWGAIWNRVEKAASLKYKK